MVNYSRVEEPCFVCVIEDNLNEPRGTQSHPINCGWRLKEEYKVMEEELKKDGKILLWSESENKPIVFVQGNDRRISSAKLLKWLEESQEAASFWGSSKEDALEAFDKLTDAINNGELDASK